MSSMAELTTDAVLPPICTAAFGLDFVADEDAAPKREDDVLEMLVVVFTELFSLF